MKHADVTRWLIAALVSAVLGVTGCSKSSSPEPDGAQPSVLKAYGLTASAADSAAALSWPNLSGATAYNLYWSTRADVSPANATKIANVASPYTHPGLSNGTAYHYLFTAVTPAGESTPSNTVKVTPKSPSDGAPAKVSALAGDGRITLAWDAVLGATTYTVYWNTRGDVKTQDTRVENITYPAVHTGLTNGQQYYYIVTATTSTYGEVASAEVSTAPHLSVPDAPLSVSVSAGDRQANLSWTPVSDASGYAIYWNSSGNVSLADARMDVATSQYTHTGLNNGTRYFYRIAALNTQGLSILSAEVSAKPHVSAPGAPRQVSATAGNEQITLKWDLVSGASQYNLYWDTGGAGTVIANIQPPYVHMPLTGGIPVNYAVTALREGVESAGSAQISATPLGPLPRAPTQFSALAAKNQITLTWNAVEPALSYRVYWHTQGNSAEATFTTTAPSYTHTGLLDNTTYLYSLAVITADGISPRSAEIEATTLPATAPTSSGPPDPVGKLNDTGITASQCYQAGSDVLVACSSPEAIALSPAQDGMVGRDANVSTNSDTDGKGGFSFTKVCNSGELAGNRACPAQPALGSAPTDWGCTQDQVTGLMWEVKTADALAPGLRDWTYKYTNYDSTSAAQKWDPATRKLLNPTQADIDAATNSVAFKNSVNNQTLCGHNDWRLPSADELQSIVDYGVASPGPTIDTSRFPNTGNHRFLSASPYVRDSSYAWNVRFDAGTVNTGDADRGSPGFVRLVRAGQWASAQPYAISASGLEVTDPSTGLIWRRCVEGMNWDGITCTGTTIRYTHELALQHAANQAFTTGVAWRLPNIKELTSIVDRSRVNPAIEAMAFPTTNVFLYWSASLVAGQSSNAWIIDFSSGIMFSFYPRLGPSSVRLVRTAQ